MFNFYFLLVSEEELSLDFVMLLVFMWNRNLRNLDLNVIIIEIFFYNFFEVVKIVE